MAESSSRIAWIDFAKGIAIILVVWGHTIVGDTEANKFFAAFRMPFFFVTAGFLLNLSKWGGAENFKKFAAKLFKRLLVPYYVAEILWYPIWFWAGHVMGHTAYIRNEFLTPVNALCGIFIGNGNLLALVPLWFLPALFFAELIFIRLHNRFAATSPEIFSLIIVALSYVGYLVGQFIFLPMSLDVALTAQIFLLAGVLIRKYNVVERLTFRHALILLNIFIWVFILNGKISMNARAYGDWFLLNVGGIAGTLLIMKFCVQASKVGGKFSTLMKFCGRQSLFVMTAHLIIAFAIYDLVVNFAGLPLELVRSLPTVIFAITLLGLLVPLWIAERFGKLPVLKIFCA